jgi:hypothetical protein
VSVAYPATPWAPVSPWAPELEYRTQLAERDGSTKISPGAITEIYILLFKGETATVLIA